MTYSNSLSLNCPHCNTKCQFIVIEQGHQKCISDNKHHIPFTCTNCKGLITTMWTANNCDPNTFRNNSGYLQELNTYYPIVGDWKPRVNIQLITNNDVKMDFKEAIDCYNNGFYNACMMMARRAIQQEMLENGAKEGDNLYKQIEATGISKKLKALLHKVKNFGNNGAHPDFCLFDENGNQLTDKKEFSKLSLEFLDRYFADEYEIDSLVNSAPRSQKELEKSNE